jgi:hypothetical protein
MDYTAYYEISERFTSPVGINETISDILNNPPSNFSGKVWLISGDDKGVVDITYWAFRIFGARQESIYHFVMLLFSASCLLYLACFIRSPLRIAAGLSVVLGIYAMLFAFHISDQFSTLSEPRFLGFVSILATLQLLLLVQQGTEISTARLVLTALQALIVAVIVHTRSSEQWQVLAVIALYAGCITLGVVRRLRAGELWGAGMRRVTVSRTVVTLLPILATMGVGWYAQRSHNQNYSAGNTQTHIFWHNAVMALAVDPYFRTKYGLAVLDDVPTTRAVYAFLTDSGELATRDRIFADPDYAGRNFAGFDWATYEVEAKRLYWRIVTNDWQHALEAYAVMMPETFVANVDFMATGRTIFPDHLYPVGTIKQVPQRDAADAYLRVFRPEVVAVLLVASVMIAGAVRRPAERRDAGVILAVLVCAVAFSLIPPFVALPVMMYVQVSVVLILAGLYWVVTLLLGRGLAWGWVARAPRFSRPARSTISS